MNGVWAYTSTLTFTAQCNGSGTASTADKLAWSIASNATESTYDSNKGIHYGTNNATVQYVTLTTTNLYAKLGGKKITEVTVNCTDAASTSTASVTVGGVAFSVKSGSTASVSSTQGDKTFTGSKIVAADETIVIDIRRASNTKKAIYVKSVTITYEEGLSNPNFSFPPGDYNATYGSDFSEPALSTADGYDGDITYSSSNELVATVNNKTGDITLVGGGTARITASGTGGSFADGSAYYDLTVTDNRADHGLTYATSAVPTKIGVTGYINTLTNPNLLSVTYSSSDEDVATVNATTGAITALTAGQTTITASFTGNATYKAGSASYTLTVSDGAKWVKVTDAAKLHAGDQIIIVNETNNLVLGEDRGNNRLGAEIKFSGGVATPDAAATIITLEKSNGKLYLSTADGYLVAASSSSNYLRVNENKTTDGVISISISNGDATITFSETDYSRKIIRCNSGNTPPLFSCYESGKQSAVQIYKKISDVSVTVSSVGYATLHYGDRALTVPAGMEAYTYLVNAQNKLEESWLYEEGDVIPAGQAVVLKAAAGTYNFELATTDGQADSDSQLKGLDEEGTTTGTGKFYHLTLVDKDDVSKGAGFFWGNDGGAEFTIAAHKAYLVVPTAGVRGYMFNGEVDDDLTAIESAVVKSAQGPIYDLQGRRVEKMTRGIYLVDGKKVMK